MSVALTLAARSPKQTPPTRPATIVISQCGTVSGMASESDLHVWVDQDLCTGDGLCAQYAPEVFEFDIDGLAYVKDDAGELQLAPGAAVVVPRHLRLDVLDAIKDCPGECIHLRHADGPAEPLAEADREALRADLAA